MSSVKFCHCSTGLLKNVYLVLINSLRYRKKVSTSEIFLSLIDNLKSLQSKSYFSSKSLTKFFSALLIQQVCKLVKGFWKKIRKQFYGLMVCQSTWEWKKVFLKMLESLPSKSHGRLSSWKLTNHLIYGEVQVLRDGVGFRFLFQGFFFLLPSGDL